MRFAEDLTAYGTVEGMPRLEGRNAHVLITPVKTSKPPGEKPDRPEKPNPAGPPPQA